MIPTSPGFDEPRGACCIGGENATPFRIGAKKTLPISNNGYLYLAINDDELYFEDNLGTYSVSTSVK
jgi:hypothetical protein